MMDWRKKGRLAVDSFMHRRREPATILLRYDDLHEKWVREECGHLIEAVRWTAGKLAGIDPAAVEAEVLALLLVGFRERLSDIVEGSTP